MSCKTVIIEASGQSPPGPKPSVVAVGLFRFFEVLLVCLLLSVMLFCFSSNRWDSLFRNKRVMLDEMCKDLAKYFKICHIFGI